MKIQFLESFVHQKKYHSFDVNGTVFVLGEDNQLLDHDLIPYSTGNYESIRLALIEERRALLRASK